LRRWLPVRLDLADLGLAPDAERPPVCRAAEALLLVCAHAPLPLRADHSLSVAALRRVMPLLDVHEEQAATLCAFTWPLLLQLGLVCAAAGSGTLAPAAGRFLAQAPETRRAALQAAWLAAPGPDAWARPLLRDQGGIDWPCLRRRLYAWADSLPLQRLLDADALYPALSACHGPLADAHTHGFRPVGRVPWQPRRAAAIWAAALHGPLTWLGLIAWDQAGHCFRPTSAAPDTERQTWAYADPTTMQLPPHALGPAALQLARYAPPVSVCSAGLRLQLCPAQLAHASAAGLGTDALRVLLEREAGPLPPSWDDLLGAQRPSLRISSRILIEADTPTTLSDAAKARSVRRHLGPRLAPDLATVAPEQLKPLVAALARQGVAASIEALPEQAAGLSELHPGEQAALLIACAFYRLHAPPDAPLAPGVDLERRLRASLPPTLNAAVDAALGALDCADSARPDPTPWDASTPAQPALEAPGTPALTPLRQALRRAIERGETVELHYFSPDDGPSRRTVRPLELEQRGDYWYLRAFCTLRRAERSFRLDRIRHLGPPSSEGTGHRGQGRTSDHDLIAVSSRRADRP
jgi:hypothetical protein